MSNEQVTIEKLLLAILAADNDRRLAALRVLQGEAVTEKYPEATTGPLLMRIGEAARYLGISRSTLWRMITEGRLDHVELRRGSHRVRKADLDRFGRGHNAKRKI